MLYVIDSLAPGGAETSLGSIAPALVDAGVDLHVAYFHERPGVAPLLVDAGATLHHVDASRFGRIRDLRRLIAHLTPDVVHTTLFEADQAGRIAGRTTGVPVLSSLVSTGFELGRPTSTRGLRARAALAVDVATAHLADHFHAVSEPVAEAMSRRLHVSRRRFTVVARGRDPETLGRRTAARRDRVRRTLGIEPDEPVVLAVGRQVLPKQHVTLIDAIPELARRHRQLTVLLAGQRGPLSEAVDRRIEELAIADHVRRLGHRDDVADLLVAADVLAFPSSREGFPGTLVEALALECPIVASDIPAIRSVVGADLAALVPVGDSAALAAAVDRVLTGGIAAEVVQAGRAAFEREFTIDAVATQMHQLYLAVASAPEG